MDLKNVGIISNPKKDIDFVGAASVSKALRARGIAVWFDENGLPKGEHDLIDYTVVDCLFVLGGDGTLLKAATDAGEHGVCILGINLGRLGFLTEVELNDIEAAIERIIAGQCYVEQRLMLSASVMQGDKTVFEVTALNDVALVKKDMARMINIELIINGALADKMPCDGMLIATPTGSTAYSLSAGGPIVSPRLKCILATPLNAHTLHSKPIIASPDDIITLKPTVAKGALLTSDGVVARDMQAGEVVKIKRSKYLANFIRFNEDYFYPLLRSKFLNWDK